MMIGRVSIVLPTAAVTARYGTCKGPAATFANESKADAAADFRNVRLAPKKRTSPGREGRREFPDLESIFPVLFCTIPCCKFSTSHQKCL
jgi:hypothetical protein